jgi:hypothetical protein
MWKNHSKLHRVYSRLIADLAMTDEVRDLWNTWKQSRLSQKLDLFPNLHESNEFCISEGILDALPQLAVYLSFWHMKDNHLKDWEINHRRKCHGRRGDQFNVWAKWIDSHYETIVFEDEGLAAFAERADDDKQDPGAGFRKERSKAAPGYFKEAVVSKCGKTRVREVKSKFNTLRCSFCGHVNDWDTKGSVVHICGGCGREHDQDQNNAMNQLRIAIEGPGDGESTDIARSKKKQAKSATLAAAE